MIIRSADGESIVNFDNMSMVQMESADGKYTIYAYDTGSTIVVPIGKYSTREQALDVIDGIEGCYLSSTAFFDTSGNIFNPSHGYVQAATVYHMPEDAGKDYMPDDEED